MADRQTRVMGGNLTRTQSFELAPGILQYVQSVLVEVDATASPDTTAALTVQTQDAVAVATVEQGRVITGGATGRATWALRLSDETPPPTSPLPAGFGLGARVSRNTTTQTIAPNASTNISFDTTFWASPGMVDLATHPDRITLPVDGQWQVFGEAQWASLAGDVDARRTAVIQGPIGGYAPAQNAIYKQDATNFFISVGATMRLTAAQWISLAVIQRAAGNRILFATLSAQWVGPLI